MFAKKIVAGAALLALAATAQAQVKLYGALDLSFGSFKDFDYNSTTDVLSKGKALTKVQSGSMMTSFIGFSGSEDLGGGLKAEFTLESFIAPDTGSSAAVYNLAGGFWGRGSNIALSGGFGKVALGQYDNAFFILGLSYNPFGSSMTFAPAMVSFYSGGVLSTLGYDTGWVNSITYESPVYSGFQFTAQFAPKEVSAGGDAKNHFTVGGSYNAGPLSLMAAYSTSGNTADSDTTKVVATDAYFARQKNFALGGSYDFGVAKAMVQYAVIKTTITGSGDGKATFFQVGASVPVSAAGSVLVSYGQTKYDYYDDAKLKQFSLGYDHFISKRTDVYAALTNKKVTDVGAVNTFAVGIKHAF